jgi:hypothetical protein
MGLWLCPLSNSSHKRIRLTAFLKIRMTYVLLVILPIIFCAGCDTSIMKYEPQNHGEREIISLLIEYKEAKYNFEIDKLLPLLHDRGEFNFQCGQMVSKTDLKEMLPGFWATLRSGDIAIIPLVHECINGDYYESGEFNNPVIEVRDSMARVNVLFTNGVCRAMLYFSLCCENDRWLITRTEWGEC